MEGAEEQAREMRCPEGDFSSALAALEPELWRLDRRELVPVNLDVAAAAIMVKGTVPKLAALRPAMVEWFGEEMAVHVDRLEPAARAAWAAHSRYGAVVTGAEIPGLSERVVEQRTLLLAECTSLAARKVLSPRVLEGLAGVNGYRSQISDVLRLAAALSASWDRIAPATRLTRDDLGRAEALADRLGTAVGLREQAASSREAQLRQRAFTHLCRTYGQVRRMLAFLRFEEGDLERIAPSLWLGRSRRKRSEATGTGGTAAGSGPSGVE